MKIWLDDLRAPPTDDDEWIWVTSSAVAKGLVALAHEKKIAIEMSFDHDLGGDDTAMPVALMIEEGAFRGELPRVTWRIHSANPVGRLNLQAALGSADRYWDDWNM